MNQTEPALNCQSQDHCSRCTGALLSSKPYSTCCVMSRHDTHDVSYMSRMSRRAFHACHLCRVVLPDIKSDTARHDFLLCQNSWATSWCDVPSGILALAYTVRRRIVLRVTLWPLFLSSFLPVPWLWLSSYRKLRDIPCTTTSLLNHTISGGSRNFGTGGEDIPVVIYRKCTHGHRPTCLLYRKRCFIEKKCWCQ